MHSMPVRRSFLGALLALLVSAVLLSTRNDGSSKYLVKRSPLTEKALLLNSSSDEHVPQLLGHQNTWSNASHPHPSRTINKRAPPLKYEAAVCTGRALYEKILAASEGTGNPGHTFSPEDLANGWIKDEEKGGLDDFWENAFKYIGKTLNIEERMPTNAEMFLIDLMQKKPFQLPDGTLVEELEKAAHFEANYIPVYSAIVVINVNSPRNQVIKRFQGNVPADILRRVPPLNRLSDVMWTIWSIVTQTPNKLRFIAHDNVSNGDTFGIMQEIFNKGAAKGPINWPGLKFGIDSEEFMALLGTPNGYATAYLLIDRAAQLGRRVPEVSIFSPFPEMGGWYRMVWDLRPFTAV